MARYSIEPRTRKYIKGHGYFSFGRILSNKYEKQTLHTAKTTRLDALKTTSKKVAHKTVTVIGEFIGKI